MFLYLLTVFRNFVTVMGKQGSEFEFKQERDNDLINVYRLAMKSAKYPVNLTEVLTHVVNSPSKRFWVSSERASNVISEMYAGKDLSGMKLNKRLMFREIFRIVKQMKDLPQYRNCRLSELVSTAIEQPAPRFYITPESAKIIIHHIKKRACYKQRLQRLPFLH